MIMLMIHILLDTHRYCRYECLLRPAGITDSLHSPDPQTRANAKDTVAGALALYYKQPKDSTARILNGVTSLLRTDSIHVKPFSFNERDVYQKSFQYYKLHIPSNHADTIRVRAPYLVTELYPDGEVIANDTSVSEPTFFQYWDTTSSGGTFGLTQ
jgi:hypothetical protein